MTSNLVEEEAALESAIRERPNQRSLYLSLTRVLSKLGKVIPPHVERRGLELLVEQYPERSDLFQRLCFLRLQQREHLTKEEINRAFPQYVGVAQMYPFLSQLFLPAQNDGNADHLELPTQVLYERFPDCPVCLHYRASWLFHFGNVDQALQLLESARNLTRQHDYLAQLHATVLRYLKREDESKRLILDFFKNYDGDLWRTPDFRAKQAKAIKRGVPPILVVTLPKSGSVFLLNTLARGLSVPTTYLCPLGLFSDVVLDRRVRDFAEGGALAVDHLEATDYNLDSLHRHGIRKVLFHYRDLRQSSVSFVHHSVSDENSSSPRKKVIGSRQRVEAEQRVFEASYDTLFSRWLPRLEKWADWIEHDDRFEVMVTNFDDLENERDLIGRVLRFFEIPQGTFDWSVLASDKKERAGHFRKGLKNEWQEVLSAETKEKVARKLERYPVLTRLDNLRKASA